MMMMIREREGGNPRGAGTMSVRRPLNNNPFSISCPSQRNCAATSALRSGSGRWVIGEFPSSLVRTQLLSLVWPAISTGNQRLIRTTRGPLQPDKREAEINNFSKGAKKKKEKKKESEKEGLGFSQKEKMQSWKIMSPNLHTHCA